MKRVLPDECIDERFRHELTDCDCQTANYAGLAGLQNGRLLDAAEAAGFDVLVTVDQNIPNQQNLGIRKIAIVILIATTSRLRDLMLIVPEARNAIARVNPGEVRIASLIA